MKLFNDFEAVKFPEENLIFITHSGYLYYIYNFKYQYWCKHRNAGNDHITVANYPDVSKEELANDMHSKPSIICIEDVDYLSGKDVTQEYLAQMILIAARKHTVILTGNSVQQKLPVLCELCDLEILTAAQKGGI